MTESNYSVKRTDAGVSISGPVFSKESDSEWSASEMGPERLLLQSKAAQKQMVDSKIGNSWCSVDVFTDFLFGMKFRSWSGAITVDTGLGVKKIYFKNGEIVFASTNVIDDRLGEIIYRQGMLKLDDLMNCSVQVTRTTKFGQVLLQEKVFTNVELWEALKAQVRSIVRSVFMVDNIYFEMDPKAAPAPTEVVYIEGAQELIESSYGYGCMFRDFVSRLQADSQINILNYENLMRHFGEGSFSGDLLTLAKDHASISKLLGDSKLLKSNTLGALMNFVNLGYCEISNFGESKMSFDRLTLGGLRNKIDAYTLILKEVRKAFDESEGALPINDLRKMISSLDGDRTSTIYLNSKGEISQASVERMYSQCRSTHSRAKYFEKRIQQLILFLFQITGDNLPYETAKKIRNSFRNIS